MGKIEENHQKIKASVEEFIAQYDYKERLSISIIADAVNISSPTLNKIYEFQILKRIQILNKINYISNYIKRRRINRSTAEYKAKTAEYRRINREILNEKQKQKQKDRTEKKRLQNKEKISHILNNENLIWKSIDGHKDYIISNTGVIINITTYTIKQLTIGSGGYIRVCLNGKSYSHHRLIGNAFIPNPDNKPEINHKNGVRDDNRIENLEWMTHQENIQYSFDHLNRKSNLIGHKGRKSKINPGS